MQLSSNHSAIFTTVVPDLQPPCVTQTTDATLGKFIYLTGGLHSLMPGTSQKTTSNFPCNKQEERWAPWAFRERPFASHQGKSGREAKCTFVDNPLTTWCCTKLPMHVTPLDVSYISRRYKVVCSVYRESGAQRAPSPMAKQPKNSKSRTKVITNIYRGLNQCQ